MSGQWPEPSPWVPLILRGMVMVNFLIVVQAPFSHASRKALFRKQRGSPKASCFMLFLYIYIFIVLYNYPHIQPHFWTCPLGLADRFPDPLTCVLLAGVACLRFWTFWMCHPQPRVVTGRRGQRSLWTCEPHLHIVLTRDIGWKNRTRSIMMMMMMMMMIVRMIVRIRRIRRKGRRGRGYMLMIFGIIVIVLIFIPLNCSTNWW